MKVLIVLVAVFAISSLISRLTMHSWNVVFAGNMAMCLMLCFTALGHFLFTKGMVMMIPPFIPYKAAWVHITGVAEILLGLALLAPALRPYAGWILIVFFVLILPANIYAASQHLNLEKATYTGPGLAYLWFRIPEQVLYIIWVYYFTISRGAF
ncbi:hypothetical protein F0L74_15065 [Chitinophaga agrisoli]|uniref:DoxX-like protein n=1 Tax=Chitinophaga agrisoli TaxID=2607653 RepID=A0A5B2VXM7_9BACT|nr:hypothetical protein [Chitinophaga agrisoli]KAA2243795.1 hypothetical protein F0L74_15065 [Chitinophaga agrisoli]